MFGPRNSSECLYGSGAPNLCANVCTGRVHRTRTNISRSQHRPSSARGRPVQTFDVQTSGGARAAARSGPPPPRKNVWTAECLAHETLQMFVRVGRMKKCLYVSGVERNVCTGKPFPSLFSAWDFRKWAPPPEAAPDLAPPPKKGGAELIFRIFPPNSGPVQTFFSPPPQPPECLYGCQNAKCLAHVT